MSSQFESVISYNNKGPAPSHIAEIQDVSQQVVSNVDEFFPGACHACCAMPAVTGAPVLLCAGCQLVSYCNKNCQRAHWKLHKIACKQFPVEMGKTIIERKTKSVHTDNESLQSKIRDMLEEDCIEYDGLDSYNFRLRMCEIIDSVKEKTGSVEECTASIGVRDIFLNPPVCRICYEARKVMFDCRCCSASYCSESHRMMDTEHLSNECDILYGHAMANWYLTQHKQLQIPDGLLDEVNLNYGINFKKVSKLSKYSKEKWLGAIVHLINVRLTFPLTIHYALKNLKLGEQEKGLSEIKSLTIHIVQSIPMLDPRVWEFLLHQLPNLKILNLTFINRHMEIYNSYNTNLLVQRCSDCKRKRRFINYNIQPIHYHEYFSSDDYVEPDVVAVFDTTTQLLTGKFHTGKKIDKAQRFTSHGNMTYSKHTVVILTAFEDELLEDCAKSFHDARPVKVLLPVQENPVARFNIHRMYNSFSCSDGYLCCIQGNH